MDDLKYTTLFSKYNDDCDTAVISKACVYLPNEAIVLSTKGEVFHVNNTGFIKLKIFSKKTVLDFAVADATSILDLQLAVLYLVITEFEIFGWGPNRYRQISFNNGNDVPQPIKIAIPWYGDYKFANISCVFGHCIALTTDNTLILWGCNYYGQIGNGCASDTETPYRIKFRKKLTGTDRKDKRTIQSNGKIVSISCSARNSYVLLDNGDVYGWGQNRTGQMGTLRDKDYVSPHKIYSRMKQFVAVRSHALALRYDGALFGNGDNSFEPIRFDIKFEKCATWHNLSMGLTSDGKCYIWGYYGLVEFQSIRLKITIDNRKGKHRTRINDDEIEDKPPDYNQINATNVTNNSDNTGNTNPENESKNAASSNNNTGDTNNNAADNAAANTQNNNASNNANNTEKDEEKRKIRELLNSGKIENHKAWLTLEKPTEIKCKSFSKIIAKRFDELYITAKSDMSNGYRDDNDMDLIDFSNFMVVIYEYKEIIEQVVDEREEKKEKDKKEKDGDEKTEKWRKELEERLVKVEKQETKTVKNYNYGSYTKSVMFDKATISAMDHFVISDNNLTGIDAAPGGGDNNNDRDNNPAGNDAAAERPRGGRDNR